MREIASDFEEGLARIREKYNKAGYSTRFVNSVISSFTNDNAAPPPPPPQQRDINKMRVLINLPFCPENEKYTQLFLSKLNNFYGKQIYISNPVENQEITVTFPIKG